MRKAKGTGMNCAYCNIAIQPGEMRCHGCGAPSAMPFAEPAGTASSIYEQIGRAVVNREPNETLDRLIAVGERKNAPPAEKKVARTGKILFCLFILWQFPLILIPLLTIGATFFIWIYLPYTGIKRLLSWLSS